MAIFRLLQVTDLHISVAPDEEIGELALWLSLQVVNPSRARKPILEAVADFLVNGQSGIDAILLSGDLADDGEMRNLEAAKDFIEAPAESTGSCFGDDGFPTLAEVDRSRTSLFVLPGNHDRFRGIQRLPGGVAFDQVFGAYWKRGIGGVQSLFLEKDDGSLGLIAADFCLEATKAPLNTNWGLGEATAPTLKILRASTEQMQAQHAGVGLVWVFHFPPFLDIDKRLELLSAKEVLGLAKSLGVRYILAGHLHRNQQVDYDGVRVICTGSAASEDREFYGNWIRLLEFDVTPGGMNIANNLFRYEASEGAFLPEQPIPVAAYAMGTSVLAPSPREK